MEERLGFWMSFWVKNGKWYGLINRPFFCSQFPSWGFEPDTCALKWPTNMSTQSGPAIESLTGGASCRWSVMVPTYRPQARYLEKTILSVLRQNKSAEEMQIEVVDDCTPDANVKELVKCIAGDRVAFSRTPANLGLAGCWNKCIERSTGEWVHILHQDDYVLPGFYDRLATAARLNPDVCLLAARSFFVDEEDVIIGVTPWKKELSQVIQRANEFYYTTPIQCAGVVVKRTFYETHGGYLAQLKYLLDCEMWVRAICACGGLVTPDVLSCYRVYGDGETNRLARNGELLHDYERLNALFARRFKDFDRNKALDRVCSIAWTQAAQFAKQGDRSAADANMQFWKTHAPIRHKLRKYIMEFGRTLQK